MDEFDELLEGQTSDGSAELSKSLKKYDQLDKPKDMRNVLWEQEKQLKVETDPYGLDFSKLNKGELMGIATHSQGIDDRFSDMDQIDRVKDASNNSLNQKRILNENGEYEDFNPDEWTQSGLSSLGYNDFLYERPIAGTENIYRKALKGSGKLIGDENYEGAFYHLLEKFDSGQQYDFLVPTVDPETGKNILRRVSGTYDDVVKKGYNTLNKYGVDSGGDNMVETGLKSFLNTLGETDDIVLSAAKYAQDAALWASGNEEQETGLDQVWDDAIKDTRRSSFIVSDESHEFGSLDWFASGAGSAFGSLLQFGGTGRGLRGFANVSEGIVKTMGTKALEGAIANKIVTYGSSGIIGFGHGYNEALQSGLDKPGALLYGTLVGGINSAIELSLGQDFDKFLTGGGPKIIAKDILREVGGNPTEKNLRTFLREKGSEYIAGMSDRFKNMASEAGEEVLQDVVEQGSKLAYNAVFAGDDEIGNGRFNIREFDFSQTVAAGIFGAVAAAPFNTVKRGMAHHIAEGNGADVITSLDNLKAQNKISQEQYNSLKSQAESLISQFDMNKALLNGITGDMRNTLVEEAQMLISKRGALESERDNIVNGLQNKSITDADSAKVKVDQINSEIAKVSERIIQYGDPNFLKQRASEINKSKEIAEENKNNIFGQIAATVNYNFDQSATETISRIGSLTADFFAQDPIARTPQEAVNILQNINKFDPSIPPLFANQIRSLKLHFSPLVNTMENRKALLDLGINEQELPLTREEQAEALTNPEKFVDRFITPDQFNQLIEAAEVTGTALEKLKSLMINPESGLTDTRLHSLDNREELAKYLRPEQVKAVNKILESTLPAAIRLLGGSSESAKGFYADNARFLAIDGVTEKLQEALDKGNAKDAKRLQDHLFHVIAHELGHAAFNRDLEIMHRSWVRQMTPGAVLTPRQKASAAYFGRLFSLAQIAYDSLNSRAGAKKLYFFNTIAPNYYANDTRDMPQEALGFVREFFAETLSNEKHQQLLESFDFEDARNQAVITKYAYTYVKPTIKAKETLLSQAIKAVSSVFQTLRNILSREERTLLTESFALSSAIDFNRFYATTAENALKPEAANMTISDYNGVNIFEGEQIDHEQFLALLYKRLEKAGVRLTKKQQDELLDRMKDFVRTELLHPDNDELLQGSMIVVYFKTTNSFMVSWKTVGSDGDNVHRAFFNNYGRKININTNVNNLVSTTTISKPNIFEAFAKSSIGSEAVQKRKILNNFEKAVREKFAGEAFLQYDPNHSWNFEGRDVRGQVNVMYKFTDGTIDTIGYAPDLAKVRLAHLLSNGSNINVVVETPKEGAGSSAYVKRDSDGNIVEVYRTNDKSINQENYQLEIVSPSVEFRYAPSTVPANVALTADEIDTLTTDDPKLEPKAKPEELLSGRDIIRAGYFSKPRMESLSFYEGNDEIQAYPELEFFREGLGRFMRRALFFSNKKELVTNDLYEMASEYNLKAAEAIRASYPNLTENADQLGFGSIEEFVDFSETVIQEVANDWKTSGNINSEDWSGNGGNPSGRISAGIKADLEALSVTYRGEKKFVDFSDAKNVLFEASAGTSTYEQMVENLKKNLDDKIYGGLKKAVAESIYNHLSKDRSEVTPENEFFNSIKNSYWSQFGSYIRLDAITFAPRDESSFIYFNGERSYLDRRSADYALAIESRINEVIDRATTESGELTPEAKMNAIKEDFNRFFIERHSQKLIQDGTNEQDAISAAEELITTQSGKRSNVINKLISFKSNNGVKEYNLNGFSSKGIMVPFSGKFFDIFGVKERNSGAGYTSYKNHVALLDSYFAYFGIELPEVLTDLKQNVKNLKSLMEAQNDLIKKGHPLENAQASIRRAMENTPVNDYFMVQFKPRGTQGVGDYPFMMFAVELVDFLNHQVTKHTKGEAFDYNIGELDILSKTLMQLEGSYRSPEFYFNAEFEKEWSMKIRSYTDSLVEGLSKDKSVLNNYLSKDLYKNNRFLKTIQASKGAAMQFQISGIKGVDNAQGSKSYTNAGDLDYLYMNISGFVHNYGSDVYYHIDDVPSDKPKNMAYRMLRISRNEVKQEIENIIELEKSRLAIATERFLSAFSPAGKVNGTQVFTISDEKEFDKLIPGVHYGKPVTLEDGTIGYSKGWIFDKKNYFYGGSSSSQIISEIESESNSAYQDFVSQGMNFPVPTQFLRELNEKNLTPEQKALDLRAEQQRIFKEWMVNSIINRYHLNQVLMGDYIYYKPDQFSDLNKRHAGTVAPSSKGIFNRPTLKAIILQDAGLESSNDQYTIPELIQGEDGAWSVNPDSAKDLSGNINRTDAQGYVTEKFAAEIQSAYGSFSGYEKIFKPVVYGINKKDIEYGQPIYFKLSLAVLPDPFNEANADYYRSYPKQRSIAEKIYNSGADFATFTTGVKVGINTVNKIESESYETIDIDSNLFGLQNNPYHDPNSEDNYLSGMVQQTKQLGDNGNYIGVMENYHKIEGSLVDREVQSFFDREFNSDESVNNAIKSRLEKNEFSAPIADFINQDVRVLDNPVTAKFAENMMNAMYKNAIQLYPKDGDKLVNVSEYGFSRPEMTTEELSERRSLLAQINIPYSEPKSELLWAGPRTPADLTLFQLRELVDSIADGSLAIGNDLFITDSDNNAKIFPAEALVPEGPNYQIGDRMIATRIPTSKKSSSIPSIVVGHTHPSQGNIIIVGKAGTAVLGFDFDVDGLFVWRERQRETNHPVRKMFDIAFNVLTNPGNYAELTSLTTTDNIAQIADEIDQMYEGSVNNKRSYSKFSPMRQIQLKKLNSVGKVMIGVSASQYGIHSVLEQNDGSPFNAVETDSRSYLYNDSSLRTFTSKIIDENGQEVFVTDIYSEFINAAADNAKLQYLGRINANPTTAQVLFDMISHGVSLRYALYFINQPIIREYVRLNENQKSASYKGRKGDIAQILIGDLENQIRALGGSYANYSFNARRADGSTDPESKAITHFVTSKSGFNQVSSDKVNLSIESLIEGIKGVDTTGSVADPVYLKFNNLENQIVVLDKFLYYRNLATISANAGKLVTLTSGYPKTFIELIDRKAKIDSASSWRTISAGDNEISIPPSINIENLKYNHGMYKVHWARMNDLIDNYSKFKLYAHPAIMQMHNEVAAGKSIAVQQKLHDDFYTYILSLENESDNDNFVYNLSTSSLNGNVIDPYFFVDQSARVINELKKKFPANDFLRILKVSLQNEDAVSTKSVSPSQVTIALESDPDGDMLDRIRTAFTALPTNFELTYNEGGINVTTDIVSTQDVILGHLLYTQGFSLGGFSFSKLLPVETVRFFDNSVKLVESRLNSYIDLNESNIQDGIYSQEDLYNDAMKDAGLSDFVAQAKRNIPELITKLTPAQIAPAIRTENGHFEQWSAETTDNRAFYNGLMSIKTKPDGGEKIVLQYKKNNAENVRLIKRLVKQGLVRMNDQKNNERVYSVSPMKKSEVGKYTAYYIELETENFINYPNLKQYGSLYFNELSNASIEEIKAYDNDPQPIEPLREDVMQTIQPVYTQIDGEIDIVALREGRQTGIISTLADNLLVGQRVSVPKENGYAVVEVKKVWPINSSYERALIRDPQTATQKLFDWATKMTGKPVTSLFDVADKYMVEVSYVASVSNDGTLENRFGHTYSDPDEDGNISPNPIETFSEYNPRESNKIYKAVLLNAGERMLSIPNIPYTRANEKEFFDTLKSFRLDSIQLQMVKDFIDNQALTESNTYEITDGMIALANSDVSLENYTTSSGFDRYTDTPLETFHEIASIVLGPKFYDYQNDFRSLMNKIVSEDLINPDTMMPYTYYEWLVSHYDKYKTEEARFREIESKIDGKMNDFTYEELLKDFTVIRQEMGSIQGLIWKKNQAFIERLGAKIGSESERKSFDVINNKTGYGDSFGQRDIKTWEEEITSITDFTESQAAMQDVGRHVSLAALKSDAEKLKTQSVMESLMRDVMTHYYAHKPKSFLDKINIFGYSKQVRDVFDWMLETNEEGEYTGRMIARYEETEDKHRSDIFATEVVVNEDGTTYEKFVISNKKVVQFLKNNVNGKITSTELSRLREIITRYNSYDNFHELYKTFNEEQKKQSGKDTTFIRNLWVKVKVKSTDSEEFRNLKDIAAKKAGTSEGKLAAAKIRLYDYLYEKSDELLNQNGYFASPIERGFFPMTGADFNETWSRYGFSEAKKQFLNDTQDDMDNIETSNGFVISYAPVMSFETSKKVPYRTIRPKENFSVNVPKIFQHHFNTLIFKKHYDPIIPIMDAVQMHYKMRKQAYGESFDNTVKYITEYVNQRIFYKQKDFSKTKWAKLLKLSSNLVVTQFLGLAPVTSFINWTVGNLETYKHLMGDYGFSDGNGKFLKGMSRIYNLNGQQVDVTRLVNGQFMLNPKALAIMNHYGIETFTSSELVNFGNVAGQIQDAMLVLQKNSEIMIRGAAFFAEMTDEQWNAFTLNQDGSLSVGKAAPSNLTVAEWKNRIGSIQGKYDEETKRLYHGNAVYQAAFLFKGWLIDYVRSRLGIGYYDQFGIQREGYYRTAWRMFFGSQMYNGEKQYNIMRFLESLRGKDTLTELEEQNLRKVYFDMATKLMILLLPGAIDSDDEKENWYRTYLGKISSQMFLLTNPSDIVKLVKSPFAGLHNLEQGAKAIDALMDLNGKQLMKSGYSMVPGRQVIEGAVDLIEDDENTLSE